MSRVRIQYKLSVTADGKGPYDVFTTAYNPIHAEKQTKGAARCVGIELLEVHSVVEIH